MENATLKVSKRDMSIKAKKVLIEGKLIAEFYGKGVENQSLVMDYQEFRRLYRTAGENTVITLEVEGGSPLTVLVHHVDFDPVTDQFIHVDFINVRMDEEVTTHVPVHLEGQAPAVKEQGGILTQSLDEIEIRCLPADLIHEVTLSVESLVDFHTVLHVSDLKVSDKIKILTDPKITIATVSAPSKEEIPTDAPETAVNEADAEAAKAA